MTTQTHSIGAIDLISHELAGRTALRVFTTPPRHARPEREKAWLEGATPFSVMFGDADLAAWSWGDESAPAVLLVHGWAGRGSQLAPLAAPLVALGYRVVTFDQPGHGATPGAGPLTLVDFAAAIAAVAATVGPLHGLVAHSFGAAAATLALSRGVTAERVVYIAPLASPAAAVARFTQHVGLSAAGARVFEQELIELAGESLERVDTLRIARNLDTPLLVIHDSGDREMPIVSSRMLTAAWPESRLLATRGLGHYRILSSDEAIDAVTGFVRGDEEAGLSESEVIDRYLFDREARRRQVFP